MSVILHYNYIFFFNFFFLLVPFGSKVVSFFTGMNQCVTQCWWHCQVKWGEQHQRDPPAPLQEVRSSGRKAQGSVWAWQAQRKKPVS